MQVMLTAPVMKEVLVDVLAPLNIDCQFKYPQIEEEEERKDRRKKKKERNSQ